MVKVYEVQLRSKDNHWYAKVPELQVETYGNTRREAIDSAHKLIRKAVGPRGFYEAWITGEL